MAWANKNLVVKATIQTVGWEMQKLQKLWNDNMKFDQHRVSSCWERKRYCFRVHKGRDCIVLYSLLLCTRGISQHEENWRITTYIRVKHKLTYFAVSINKLTRFPRTLDTDIKVLEDIWHLPLDVLHTRFLRRLP